MRANNNTSILPVCYIVLVSNLVLAPHANNYPLICLTGNVPGSPHIPTAHDGSVTFRSSRREREGERERERGYHLILEFRVIPGPGYR